MASLRCHVGVPPVLLPLSTLVRPPADVLCMVLSHTLKQRPESAAAALAVRQAGRPLALRRPSGLCPGVQSGCPPQCRRRHLHLHEGAAPSVHSVSEALRVRWACSQSRARPTSGPLVYAGTLRLHACAVWPRRQPASAAVQGSASVQGQPGMAPNIVLPLPPAPQEWCSVQQPLPGALRKGGGPLPLRRHEPG